MSDVVLSPKLPYKSAFISHAGGDKQLSLDLVRKLEERGCKCWISKRDIAPGTQWDREIMQGLRNSEVLILMLTEAANRSDYVEREVKLAFGMRKPVVPIRFGPVEPSDALTFWLAAQQLIEATPDEEGLRTVMEALGSGDLTYPMPIPASKWPMVVCGLLLALVTVGGFTMIGFRKGSDVAKGPALESVPPSPTVAVPKVLLLQQDGKTPLEGTTIKVRRKAFAHGSGAMILENGLEFYMYPQSVGSPISTGGLIELQYTAEVAGAGSTEAALDRVLVDGSSVGANPDSWAPVTKLPESSGHTHSYVFNDFGPPQPGVDPAGPRAVHMFAGRKGRIPAGKMPVRLLYYKGPDKKSSPLGEANIILDVPPQWALPENETKIRVLGMNNEPIEGQIIQATRLDFQKETNYANGILFSLKIENKGEPIPGPWHFYYYLRAAEAPGPSVYGATVALEKPLFPGGAKKYPDAVAHGYTASRGFGPYMPTSTSGGVAEFKDLGFFASGGPPPGQGGTILAGIHEIGLCVLDSTFKEIYRGVLTVELK